MQSSTRVSFSFPWEEPPLSLVFGSKKVLPAIPRVDRVGLRVDHAASVVAGAGLKCCGCPVYNM